MAAAGVPGPLDGVRVLAVGADVATRFAAWWLTESGADVAVYRPGWRPDPSDDAEARFERLAGRGLRAADFGADRPYAALVGDAASLAALSDAIPAPLRTEASVVEVTSPFPTGGSFAETQLHDMALWARSGLGYLTSEITPAWTMGEPCLPLNRQASLLAGVAAAFAVATGALARAPGAPPPRRVSFDKLELLALMPMQPIAFAQLGDRIVGRDKAAPYPGGTMAVADGMVYVGAIDPKHWASLFRIVGELDWAADAVMRETAILREARDLIDARLREWARSATRAALVAQTQAAHVPAAQVCRAADVIADPQLTARRFFEAGPGPPTPRLPWLARAGEPAATPRATAPGRVRPPSDLPLSGLRVLDLTWAWAGPFATTVLADLGAEVINVERQPTRSNLRRNPPYRDGREGSANVSGWWSANQRGKISLGVDMKTPEGVQVIRDLAARADVVVENFSPGVVDRLGSATTTCSRSTRAWSTCPCRPTGRRVPRRTSSATAPTCTPPPARASPPAATARRSRRCGSPCPTRSAAWPAPTRSPPTPVARAAAAGPPTSICRSWRACAASRWSPCWPRAARSPQRPGRSRASPTIASSPAPTIASWR